MNLSLPPSLSLTLPLFAAADLPAFGPAAGAAAGVAGGLAVGVALGLADDSTDEPADEPAYGAAAAAALPPWPTERLLQAPDPVRLHPALWRANQLGGSRQRCTPSGFATLDAELPGGGWPHGVLTELLLPHPGLGELRLLAPALAALAQYSQGSRCVMLFDPPARLSAWALAQQGLATDDWLVVQGRPHQRQPRTANGLAPMLPGADVLWALEQALRSGQVAAALAWLPLKLRADALRRLQLAAQAHAGPVFVFRDAQARSHPSAAPLRLLLQPAGVDALALRLLKRRGPLLAEPLRLQLPSVLTPRQQAQAVARQALQGAQAVRPPAEGSVARPLAHALASQPPAHALASQRPAHVNQVQSPAHGGQAWPPAGSQA